jgi:hypothetical protein
MWQERGEAYFSYFLVAQAMASVSILCGFSVYEMMPVVVIFARYLPSLQLR